MVEYFSDKWVKWDNCENILKIKGSHQVRGRNLGNIEKYTLNVSFRLQY